RRLHHALNFLFSKYKKLLSSSGIDTAILYGSRYARPARVLADPRTKKWKAIVRDQKIFDMDNVVFTPHNAFNSKEALIRILDVTIENIDSFIKKQVKNEVRK
ncbi:MAG: hypothetical protein ABIC95_00260, partial [archaeon]